MKQSIIVWILPLFALLNNTLNTREGVITGRVVADDGHPVAGAEIFAVPISGKIGSMQIAASDEEGTFAVPGLVPGVYTLITRAPGYVQNTGYSQQYHRIGDSVTIHLTKGGVITGRVTDAYGEPIVGVHVNAQLLRDLEGKAISSGSSVLDFYQLGRLTDDRGVYRIYGLDPGIYLVSANESQLHLNIAAVRRDVPTYHPSSSRATAAEITVRNGEEVTGVDIRRRNERGYSISGKLSSEVEEGVVSYVGIVLRDYATGQLVRLGASHNSRDFVLSGIEAGEYELFAVRLNENVDLAASSPKRITIKGADLTGIELKLLKLGSISGRVIIERAEPAAGCKGDNQFVKEEILLDAVRDGEDRGLLEAFTLREDLSGGVGNGMLRSGGIGNGIPNPQGEFALKNLEAGRYRFAVNLPDENWYLRGISKSAPSTISGRATKKSLVIPRSEIILKSGEVLSDVEIIIAEGAAGLRGRVVHVKDELKLPSSLKVHLIPAENSSADDILRYYETLTDRDGSFEFKHLAPGKYLLHAQLAQEKRTIDIQSRPIAWDPIERAKLRREAESFRNEIEFRSCQRVNNYVLRVNY